MRDLIRTLFEKSLELGDIEFSNSEVTTKWLGYKPASLESINKTEERLGLVLPNDYKELLLITNGFREFNLVEPSFLPVDKIDWIKKLNPELLEAFLIDPIGWDLLNRSIIIGGLNEEQFMFLIAPIKDNGEWIYWKSAYWDPIGTEYSSLKEYFLDIVGFMQNEIDSKG